MATIDLPESIERQLLALDRQVWDATFGRGISRFALITPVSLGLCLAADWWFGLSSPLRVALLSGWGLLTIIVAWRELVSRLWHPPTLPELAALVEREHPELKERLTSLVELRQEDTPGTSPVMRDLLARQTAKVVDRLDLSDAAPAIRSPGTALLAIVACLLLLAPFALAPADYGLLWARLFAPLGNFHWGSSELIVVDGDRIVAKGSDVPIRITWKQHRSSSSPTDASTAVIWLHWTDDAGVKDSRRLEWDTESQQFVTTLPRVVRNLKFHATTTGAASEVHRIDVANPPAIAKLQLDIEPPAYTGLPATALDGAQGEVRAAERSRIVIKLQFSEPVTSAELVWPRAAETPDKLSTDKLSPDDAAGQHRIPIRLSQELRSATVEALAVHSGPFAIHLKNAVGLTNDEPSRLLVVDPDLPPAISLDGTEEPVGVRPEDRYVVTGIARDEYGLSAVELHLESSTGKKRVDQAPGLTQRDRSWTLKFPIDVADFELKPGQAITYRVRAVDNRPVPGPQETWTRPRTLMVESKSTTPSGDKELANRDADVKQQIAELRKELAENKQALEKLHRKTEDESLQRKNSDKSSDLEKLEQQQAELAERLQKLAAELAEQEISQKLAEKAQKLADEDLAAARQKLEQAKEGEARDQLQPISEAIDRVAAADKQLKSIEQELTELNRLEQDLAKLEQIARNTDRLAEKLEKLDQQSQAANNQPGKEKSGDAETQDQRPQPSEPTVIEAERQKLQKEGQKLNEDLADLLKKHPELLDAARRDQLQRLDELSDQAKELAKPQDQLAKAFDQAAKEAPASAAKPANEVAAEPGQPMPDNSKPNPTMPVTPMADTNQAEQQADATRPANQSPATAPAGNQVAQAPKPAENSSPTEKVASGESNSSPAKAGEPMSKGEPDQQTKPSEPTAQQQADAGERQAGAEAAKGQQQLAQQATQQALRLAQQEGPESKATQAAAQFAKQATEAAREAQTGNFEKAAKAGEAAAQAAQDAADQLSSNGAASKPQADQSGNLAERQQQLAEQLKQMSGSKEAQQGAQQQGQQQLADAAASLTRQLEQAAQELGTAPLDSSAAAAAAAKAQQAASAARQSMKQAAEAAQANDLQDAAQQAAGAAEQLREAAQQASQHDAAPKSGDAIPNGMASKVTKAAQQLGQAQQQLEQAKTNPGSSAESEPTGGNKPDGVRQGEELARAAEDFRQAATAMRNAARGSGQQIASNNPAKSSQQGKAQQGGSEPDQKEGEAGGAGGATPAGTDEAQANADLKQLEAELKKQSQRNWGKLPGQLRTEILQGANKTPRPEYAKQIKSYFEEIAKPAAKSSKP